MIDIIFTLKFDFIFEKRATNYLQLHKIANFYVKIGLWILTTIFTNSNLSLKEELISG